jgi:hypothetical protein
MDQAQTACNRELLESYDHFHYAITTVGARFDCLSDLQDTNRDPGPLVRVASLGS